MKAFACLAALAALTGCTSLPQADDESDAASAVAADDLIGTWEVSLFFAPDEPPSTTQMEITGVDAGQLVGTFYGSPFSTARATVFDDEVIFTAVTADGTGDYIHSGELDGDEIEGQTFSIGRDFLMAWTAERAVED